MLLDARTREPIVPNGSLGFRYGEAGIGKWNLDLGDVRPLLTVLGDPDRTGRAAAPALRRAERRRHDNAPGGSGAPHRWTAS